MRRRLLAALALVSASLAAVGADLPASALEPRNAEIAHSNGGVAASAFSAQVSVEQRDACILVYAQSDVDADTATIWSTLTDYDNLAGVVPDMTLSRTVSRLGHEAIVEQRGIVRTGPIHHSFDVFMYVSEYPLESITMSTGGGDFSLIEARYDIVSLSPRRSRITYKASIVPALPVPSWLNVPVMRAVIGKQFAALISEIGRRAERETRADVGTVS